MYSLSIDSLFIFLANIHCITKSTFGNNPIKKNLNLHRIAALSFMLQLFVRSSLMLVILPDSYAFVFICIYVSVYFDHVCC